MVRFFLLFIIVVIIIRKELGLRLRFFTVKLVNETCGKMMEDCPLKTGCLVYEHAPEECNEECTEYRCYLFNVKGCDKGNDRNIL